MLGSRLARRIVLPLLVLIAALFGVLAVSAVQIADARVERELGEVADRVASTLNELRLPREHRRAILEQVQELAGVRIGLDGLSPFPEAPDLEGVGPPRFETSTGAYRVLERRLERTGERVLVFRSQDAIAARRWDVLGPVLVAGTLGLLVAGLLGLFVAHTIAEPVRRLALRATRIAAGDREAGMERGGPGEVGELQEAFARMLGAIRESEERLRENERFAALGRLAGGIAHELRNPLTAVRMAVETATAAGEEGRREARTIALAELDRLDRTLRELLDYVRPRRPSPEDLDAAAFLEESEPLLRRQCEHLRVRLEIAAEPGARLRADPDRLRQALWNLVLNAAQAQLQGGVVRVRAAEGLLSVEDEGPGIPEEVRGTLFQPFVTTKPAGIGLGLAVVRQIADEHGAQLDVESGPQGTRFTLRLPRASGGVA